MFEIIGLMIGTVIFFGLAITLGLVFGLTAWLVFWGRRRPKRMIALAVIVPPFSALYIFLCAILLMIFVPNQPDLFFGDISEPLPNGYILKGLGKMPEYSYFDVASSGKQYSGMRGGVRRLGVDWQMIYGAYGSITDNQLISTNHDNGYFILNTRTGQVKNVDTISQLNAEAGHPVQLIESQFYRSREPAAILLRRIDNFVLFGPPAVAIIFVAFLLIRKRCKPQATDTQTMKWQPPAWETPTN